MAVATRSGRTTDLQMGKKWKERESSPERTKVWIEPPHHHKLKSHQKVPVVYYISRNGQLEHPHFIEVPLSSPHGLYLTDVINRLNFLRKGMASMYAWSCKRSYKNGFVWHDLAGNDFIHPAQGHEYILKGSELLLDTSPLTSKSDETVSSTLKKPPPETKISPENFDFPDMIRRRRNQSWTAIELNEYKVYKSDSTADSDGRSAAADASTQTDDKRRRRRPIREIEEEKEEAHEQVYENHSTELNKDEISPPPSDSSPETLETLMKSDGSRVILQSETNNDDLTANNQPSGRIKAGSVLMQLISCGSMSFKDCGPGYGKGEDQGFPFISHYKSRLPRGERGNHQVGKGVVVEEEGSLVANSTSSSRLIKVEDKEYFSGSLIMETKKDQFAALKRSSSYNADRSSHLELREKEADGVRAKCIPRKPKTQSATKENDAASSSSATSDSQHVSK